MSEGHRNSIFFPISFLDHNLLFLICFIFVCIYSSVSTVVHVDNTRKEQKSQHREDQPTKRKSSVPLVGSTAHSERYDVIAEAEIHFKFFFFFFLFNCVKYIFSTANDSTLSPKKNIEDNISAKVIYLLSSFLTFFYDLIRCCSCSKSIVTCFFFGTLWGELYCIVLTIVRFFVATEEAVASVPVRAA